MYSNMYAMPHMYIPLCLHKSSVCPNSGLNAMCMIHTFYVKENEYKQREWVYIMHAQSSWNVWVSSTCLEHLPACMEREKEEDNEHDTENGEYEDSHYQVNCTERPLNLVWIVGDDGGLVQ